MSRFKLVILFILITILLNPPVGFSKTNFKRIPLQYIVALGNSQASSGNGAQSWGIWRNDPGPRGCMLENFPALKASGIAPAKWKFDESDWWLEEHGALMEKPIFPLPAGKYVVTGGRKATSVLTIFPPNEKGDQRWELNKGKLYDVTHLPCHAARYIPITKNETCSPSNADKTVFPVEPGVPMPEVKGCQKQDYAVLFVIGVGEE